MLNKKQIKFLKYVSKPRERSAVLKKFPGCKENSCIHDIAFSKFFDKMPDGKLCINDAGRSELSNHPIFANIERIILFICAVVGAVCAVLSCL